MSIVAKLMQDPNLSPAFRAALAEQTHTLTQDQLAAWPNHTPAKDTTPNGLLLSALDEAIKRAMDCDQWADYSCEIEALHEMREKVAAYREPWGLPSKFDLREEEYMEDHRNAK